MDSRIIGNSNFSNMQRCTICRTMTGCDRCCDLFYCRDENYCTTCGSVLNGPSRTPLTLACGVCQGEFAHYGLNKERYLICECCGILCGPCSMQIKRVNGTCPFCRRPECQLMHGDSKLVKLLFASREEEGDAIRNINFIRKRNRADEPIDLTEEDLREIESIVREDNNFPHHRAARMTAPVIHLEESDESSEDEDHGDSTWGGRRGRNTARRGGRGRGRGRGRGTR